MRNEFDKTKKNKIRKKLKGKKKKQFFIYSIFFSFKKSKKSPFKKIKMIQKKFITELNVRNYTFDYNFFPIEIK
jgi:hypothetical protein